MQERRALKCDTNDSKNTRLNISSAAFLPPNITKNIMWIVTPKQQQRQAKNKN